MSLLTIGHSLSFRDATTNKMLHFEYGSAGSSIGPFQAFYLGHKVTKVRFSPETAAEFFSGLDTLVRRLRAGRSQEGVYFEGDIIDFDGDASLVVDFGIASGKLYFRVGDEVIEPDPDDLGRLNNACAEFHPLARGGRRGMSMGALLARRYKEIWRQQDLRRQNGPSQKSFTENYLDWIEAKHRREFG